MAIKRAVMLHQYMDHLCVTTYSPRDGIVVWELQEQKFQQHVSAGSCDTDFPGWLIGAHPTVEDGEGGSALVIVPPVANTLQLFP